MEREDERDRCTEMLLNRCRSVSVVTVQCGEEIVGELCVVVDGVDGDRGWW